MLSGCIKPAVFQDGDYIITQGDEGHSMYIVAMGVAEATLAEGDTAILHGHRLSLTVIPWGFTQ